MDTSKTYIRMSDCLEIQEGWKPQVGDICSIDGRIQVIVIDIIAWIMKQEVIYLPRQDQIQEIMNITDGYFYWHTFYKYVFSNEAYPYYRNMTPNQIWLAFYMEKKHKKIWNCNEWIKMKEG